MGILAESTANPEIALERETGQMRRIYHPIGGSAGCAGCRSL